MPLPALAKAKAKAHQARCLSNLRQIGITYALYTSDNRDQFPFSGREWPQMGFCGPPETGQSLHQHQLLVVLPLPGGQGRVSTSSGLSPTIFPSNQRTPVSCSYYYYNQFYHTDDASALKVRRVGEVRSPSKKAIAPCFASAKGKWNDIGRERPVRHGPKGMMLLLVDGHSEFAQYERLLNAPFKDGTTLIYNPIGRWEGLPARTSNRPACPVREKRLVRRASR